MDTLKVAAIQLNAGLDKAANLKQALTLIKQAATQGARLVTLPEMFNFIGDLKQAYQVAESIPGPTSEALSEAARRHDIYLLGGSFFERVTTSNKPANTSLFIDPQGNIQARYRKIHLFDITVSGATFQESSAISSGQEVVTAETPFGVVGLSICYDLRFPELYRALTLKGAQILFVPAAFALITGKDHWEPLLRARAIENQAYIIAPGQIGSKADGMVCYGHSMVINPWGLVIAQATDQEMVLLADLDLGYLNRVRHTLPALKHRKPEVYG